MTNEEYLQTQQKVGLLAGMLVELDLDAFLARIEKAETIGPFTDPTLYREACEKLALVKGHARALSRARGEILRLNETG